MKLSLISPIISSFFLFVLGASGATVPFDTLKSNFQLGGGGGGAEATLSGAQWEVFSDDFADKITVPKDYSADITTLSTTANLDETRFGEISSNAWNTIDLTGKFSAVKADEKFFNKGAGASGLARYEMAAYLVSLYDVAQGNDKTNESIQEAIWTLMDPTAEGKAPNPNKVDPTLELENAASWYIEMNTPGNLNALNAFLGNYEVVSDPNMKFRRGRGVGGFEEQIVDPPAVHAAFVVASAVPEPRGGAWMLIGLFGLGGFLVRKARVKFAGVGLS
jgi:hypothetical protein